MGFLAPASRDHFGFLCLFRLSSLRRPFLQPKRANRRQSKISPHSLAQLLATFFLVFGRLTTRGCHINLGWCFSLSNVLSIPTPSGPT